MKTYSRVLIVGLFVLLTACNAPTAGVTPTVLQPTNTAAPTNTAQLVQTAQTAPTATNIPTLEPTEDTWQVYVNSFYGYQVSYPSDAIYLEHGVEGFPTEDLPEDTTDDEYIEYLTGFLGDSICLEIQYQTGYVAISAPINSDYQYAICGPTGVGAGELTDRSETVTIGSEQYVTNGQEYVSDAGDEHNETLWLILPDKTRITFGQSSTDPEGYQDYLDNILPVLLQIVESYDDSAAGTFDQEAFENAEVIEEQEGVDKAEFDADITIPDGTRVDAGESFTKTWSLLNAGETTWNKNFTLVFDSGDQMDGPDRQKLTQEVPPGNTAEISVQLIAPDEAGEYTGLWLLEDESGNLFGTDPDAESPFWVGIVVEESAEGVDDETAATDDDVDGAKVTAATLTVDQASYSGTCSATLNFGIVIASEGAGDFTYEFLAGANNSSIEFSLPGSQDVSYTTDDPHQYTMTFSLSIENDIDGWAQVVISEPNEFSSNIVNFTVDCTD